MKTYQCGQHLPVSHELCNHMRVALLERAGNPELSKQYPEAPYLLVNFLGPSVAICSQMQGMGHDANDTISGLA